MFSLVFMLTSQKSNSIKKKKKKDTNFKVVEK